MKRSWNAHKGHDDSMGEEVYNGFINKFKAGGEFSEVAEYDEVPVSFTKLRHDGLAAYYESKYI